MLEEVMVEVSQTTTFMTAEADNEEEEANPIYMRQSNSDGRVVRYQCRDCGFILKMPQEAVDAITVDNTLLLYQWLKRYGKQIEVEP
jgi:glycerophosphoryl diester phosphodiesterase